MTSSESIQAIYIPTEPNASPRISFSAELLDESNFISIIPKPRNGRDGEIENQQQEKTWNAEFEFLSNSISSSHNTILTADELFFEGKLLPYWQAQQAEKLNKISLQMKDDNHEGAAMEVKNDQSRVNWFIDDDPSPRPPSCTILWKELLKLKKKRASSLSPSSSSSSSSSSSNSLADIVIKDEGKKESGNKEKHPKKLIKKGLERTRSATMRIRPMINVPICTQVKNAALPPLFPIKKGRLEK